MKLNRRTMVATGMAGAMAAVTGTRLMANQSSKYEGSGVPSGAAKISGSITYNGPDIQPETVTVTKDQSICGESARTKNPLRVSDEGLLADCVIQIHGIQAGKAWADEFREAKIYQIDCGFQPRVQVVWDEADVHVVNLDPILHDINGYEVFEGTRRSMFSFSQPQVGQEDRIPLKLRRGNLINLDCNAHGWMEGWIYTSATPYFTVTGSDGAFSIDDIPPGQYELSIWHPVLGEKRGKLAIKSNEDLKYDLVLS